MRAKSGTFLIGFLLFALLGLCLLRTQSINADNFSHSPSLAEIPFLSEAADESVLGVFEGITPCNPLDSPFPQISENTNCEQMIWKLTLYHEAITGNPTTYQLNSAYGLSQQGTSGLQGGGTQLNLEGKWAKTQGAKADPLAVIYQLNPDDPSSVINFIKLDDPILHLLTQDMSLMVGNAAWSYTLNRTDETIVTDPSAAGIASPATPSLASAAFTSGVFEGRTPCVETVMAFHDVSATACQRVKLRLTLHQPTESDEPARYELLSIYVGTGDTQYRISGHWTILQGSATNPEAFVYQLDTDDAQQPLFFLKADDNHLFLLDNDLNFMVGDALLSFTLSRAD